MRARILNELAARESLRIARRATPPRQYMRLVPDLDDPQIHIKLPRGMGMSTREAVEDYMSYVRRCCVNQLITLMEPVVPMYIHHDGPTGRMMALFLDMLPQNFHDLFYSHHLANLTVARQAWDLATTDGAKPVMMLEEGVALTPTYIGRVWDAFGEAYTHFAIPWRPTRRVPPRAEQLSLVMDAGVLSRVRDLLTQWKTHPSNHHSVSISSYVDHYGSRLRVWQMVDNMPPDSYTAVLDVMVAPIRVLYLPPDSLYVYDLRTPPEGLDLMLDLLDALTTVAHSEYGRHRCLIGGWPAARFT
jgi:hypothetical protein